MDPILKIGGAVALAAVVAVAASSVGRREPPPRPAYATPAYSKQLDAQLAADAARSGPGAPATAVAADGVRLRSVGFELPTQGRPFPPGPGLDVVSANCQSCHSAGMILAQPALTSAEWTGEVNKMINTYKAPVEAAEVPAIVGYLSSLKAGT